ncbi:MAG TPA: hypothetical protein VFT41_05425, partial [Gemmatimonadaceae bacterium]|nr:hypothetical protein [Gemmatimonadaceae bacterium]
AEARLLADRGARRKAAGLYREALAWLRAGPDDPALDASVRLQMARLFIDDGRHVEAEDELRHAERLAITHNLVHHLVQVYAAMGSVRGQQLDDAGFVFFEQAIQLVPMVGRSPILEAELYYEYGAFMTRVGRPAEARAHLDRARELFESVGASSALRRVETALIQVPA